MGADKAAVVAAALRVKGVEGLRVVDAAVMPAFVRGHTTAPTLVIAERAADLILQRVAAPSARSLAPGEPRPRTGNPAAPLHSPRFARG